MNLSLNEDQSYVHLQENFLDSPTESQLFNFLSSIEYTHDTFRFGNKWIKSPRKTCSFSFEKDVTYSYAKKQTDTVFIKQDDHILRKVHTLIKNINKHDSFDPCKINHVLINCYNDGNDYMGWHKDNEKSINQSAGIFSLSIGEERAFQIKNIETKQIVFNKVLASNTLLIMSGLNMQKQYKHQLPKRPKLKNKRYNLTFRCIH